MEYRVLGKTELKVSRLGFGGIPIQRIDAEGAKELVSRMLAEGINFIDTARGYTVSEEYLGYALQGVRDKFVLATKSMARTKEAMEKDIGISLANLRTDYIDLYQIHNPSRENFEQVQQPGGALEALLEAKKAGRIGHIGITLHAEDLFCKAIECDWVETVMFPYNIVETQGEACIRKCREKGIGVIVMKPLAGGAISDAPLAMRFIAQNPNVTVAIPGMEKPEQIKQNVEAINNTAPLSTEEENKVFAIRQALGTQFCRRCNYCAPCTQGIPIPLVFTMEGYYSRYDLKQWATQRYMALPKHASDCIGCGVCEDRCPYDLPIRQMLKKVEKVFGS